MVHLIEVLKDPYDVCEFIITLLLLNASIEDKNLSYESDKVNSYMY